MLLGKNNIAMVSDFGLSRDVYESGEYENTSGVVLSRLFLLCQLLNELSVSSVLLVGERVSSLFLACLWNDEEPHPLPFKHRLSIYNLCYNPENPDNFSV